MTSRTCFQSADLVLLLGRSGRATKGADAARRHVETCEACQVELTLLQAGFDTVAPAPLSEEGVVLRRIEAAVLSGMADMETRVRRISVPGPVADRALWRLFTTGAGASVGVSLLSLLLWALLSPPGEARVASLVALLLPTLLLPGLLLPAGGRWILLSTALMSTVALTFLGVAGRDGTLASESMCLLFAGVGLIPGMAVVRAGLRHSPRGKCGGGLIGAAISAGGLGMQASLCHLDGPVHLLVLHLLPFLIGTLAFAMLSRRWLRLGASSVH